MDSQMAGGTAQESAGTPPKAVEDVTKVTDIRNSGEHTQLARLGTHFLTQAPMTGRPKDRTEQRVLAPLEEWSDTYTGHRSKRWKIRKQRENTKNTRGWVCC